MTEEEQKLYDVIADWWDKINPPPVDRDGERNKILAIINLVKSISKLEETMTDYEQQIYDLLYDWWDVIFDINPPPVDRNGEYIDKNSTITDLVKSISEIER